MGAAMRPRAGVVPDRVPVMCQLALGHYFLNTGIPALEIWHDGDAFTDALLLLQQRYGFDGVLVNLPGRDPDWRSRIGSIEARGASEVIWWQTGSGTVVPPDDLPYAISATGEPLPRPAFESVRPESLFYVEPYDLHGVTRWEHLTPWCSASVASVRAKAPDLSVHAEVFSPFSQLMELVGCEAGMLALVDEPMKVNACLERLAAGTAIVAGSHIQAGADAILVSSAFAGGGLISRRHYQEFVLPAERGVIAAIKSAFPNCPVYTHTCGAIGDRLELMEATGTDGIDTLDPPPLGTVDLADAKRRVGGRLFLKGNIDPVNTILKGTPEECFRAAAECLAIGEPGGGYILSTACSVPPRAPAENLLQLTRAVGGAAPCAA